MLLGSHTLLNKSPARFRSGAIESFVPSNFGKSGSRLNWWVGDHAPSKTDGFRAPYTSRPSRRSGGLSSIGMQESGSTGIGTVVGGVNGVGVSNGGAFGIADLALVVSASGSSFGSSTCAAQILGAGLIAGGSFGTGDGLATPRAVGHMVGLSLGVSVDTATIRAVGFMSGESTTETVLSPDALARAVWAFAASQGNSPGSMGEKVNDAGSASNPWTEVIAGGLTAADLLHVIASVSAGRATGGGGASLKFRSLDDSRDIVSMEVDANGNRGSVTINA